MNVETCIVVMYHYVRNTWQTPFPSIKALAIDDFESQLDWIQSRYNVIDYSAFESFLTKGQSSAGPCALLTFDDGFVDHYSTVFPILKDRGLGGIFFVTGSTIGDRPHLLNVHKAHFLLAQL